MPRRRFSQGAVSALQDILENLEDTNNTTEGEEAMDPEEFSKLSREEQLKVAEIIDVHLVS